MKELEVLETIHIKNFLHIEKGLTVQFFKSGLLNVVQKKDNKVFVSSPVTEKSLANHIWQKVTEQHETKNNLNKKTL